MAEELALNWQITGHDKQLGLLARALGAGRLAHAYVFAGPEQVGKRTTARRLAQFLLCESSNACGECMQCKNFAAGSNADYLEISGNKAIKIETVRDLAYKMSLRPYSGRYKIAVIDDSHNLTVEAANGLLKLMEEPKPLTLIVLITHNPHRLHATLLSRAQKIGFGPLPEGTLKRTPAADDQERENREAFQRFSEGSAGNRLVLASELAEMETPVLKKIMDTWLGYMQSALRQDPSEKNVGKIKGLMRAQRLLEQNVNVKLLLSELMVAGA